MKTFIFFIISILIASVSFGQAEGNPNDSSKVKRSLLSGISITADIGKLGLGQLVAYEDKKAFSAHILFFDRFQISGEYGQGIITPEDAFDNINYRSEGNFLRFGIDYSIKVKSKNFISLGIRKATAEYSDQGTVVIISNSDLSEDYIRTFSRNSLSANWWEFVIVSETKLTPINTDDKKTAFKSFMDNFYFGLNFRIRFLLDYPVQEGIDTYTIPGYGRTFDKSTPAVNLFLKYSIDF